jgi:hypothetical protein
MTFIRQWRQLRNEELHIFILLSPGVTAIKKLSVPATIFKSQNRLKRFSWGRLVINSRITDIYTLREKYMNDATVTADCKQIRLQKAKNPTAEPKVKNKKEKPSEKTNGQK